MERVPTLDGARLAVLAAVAAVGIVPVAGPDAPPLLAPQQTPAGSCELRPARSSGGDAPCDCARLPGRIRLLLGLPIPLERASARDLESIPGVGPARAAAIAAERRRRGPFGRVEALERVRGIGPATAARIAPHVFARGPDPACGGAAAVTVRP